MKIVKRISDNAVLFTGDDLTLENYVTGAGWSAKTFTPDIVALEDAELPDSYVGGGAWAYDGVWTVLEQDAVDQKRVELFNLRQSALIEVAKEKKNEAFYANVTIPFPVEDKEIHFRNETDRANIGDKILKAFMQVTAGNGASSIKFTPVDNVEVSMTCLQLLTAFTGLAEGKDQLFYAYNDVIADIRAASDTDELDAAEIALNDL